MTDENASGTRRPAPAPPRHAMPVAPAEPVAPPADVPANGYTSTVVAPMQILLGVASGAVIAIILTALSSGLWPIAVLIFLIAAGMGVYLAPLSVSVDDKYVTIAQGRRERDPLAVYRAEIRDAGLRNLTLVQCLGFGDIESDDKTTRLAVRPGTTLVLSLHDGQRILVSVADGHAALRAIEAATPS